MQSVRARCWRESPGSTTEHPAGAELRAGGEPAGAAQPRAARDVQLPPSARSFLTPPREPALDADLAWLAASGARIILCTDPDYPPLLGKPPGRPRRSNLLGSAPALASPQLAMVGSAQPHASGVTNGARVRACCAPPGSRVTSGLAVGIDACQHEGRLSRARVAATGSRSVYPQRTEGLAARIRVRGALLSESASAPRGLRQHFRGATESSAASASAPLVVSSQHAIAARSSPRSLAAGTGTRSVLRSGLHHSPVSRVATKLIRDGAKLVEEAADVLAELRISVPERTLTGARGDPRKPPALDKEEKGVMRSALNRRPLDVLVAARALAPEVIASIAADTRAPGRVGAFRAAAMAVTLNDGLARSRHP